MIAKPARRSAASLRGGARLIRLVALVVLATVLVRSFLLTPFTIPSDSMLPTLARGDYLIASKWPYGWSRWSLPFDAPLWEGTVAAKLPARGDVAVFRHPITHVEYVKRVIGLPGDRVALRGGALVLNGTAVPTTRTADFIAAPPVGESCPWGARAIGAACAFTRSNEQLPGASNHTLLDFGRTVQDDYGPVTVPAGHVFVLGDNRDNSLDSRFPARPGGGVGFVPAALLVARVEWVLFSTASWPSWLTGLERSRRSLVS